MLESVARVFCRNPSPVRSAYRVLWFEISYLRLMQFCNMIEGFRPQRTAL